MKGQIVKQQKHLKKSSVSWAFSAGLFTAALVCPPMTLAEAESAAASAETAASSEHAKPASTKSSNERATHQAAKKAAPSADTTPSDTKASAEQKSAETLAEDLPRHPYELVKFMTDQLLKKLERFKTLETDAEKEAFARSVVDQTFAAMVDFELIARRVMAKHYNYASEAQREEFANTFRESLINTYAMGMSAYSDQKVVIEPFEGIKDGKRKRAKVNMQIQTSDGEAYPIEYALYENEDGFWMLENLTLNGVNIGLTFRNQFNESLRANKGSIDAVISNWNSELAGIDS